MSYDIIFIVGETFFDHPLCGTAILKRLLEKNGYSVGIIEKPIKEQDITKLGRPKLFFGVSSGSIDSMVRNYTPLKKLRKDDKNLDYNETVPDRAVLVYSNWVKAQFHDIPLVLGGIEATLRRFTHYDYWQNRLRRSIMMDARADIMTYGYSEKQIIEIADRIQSKKNLFGIEGTCIISKEIPPEFEEIPSHKAVISSKETFCDMQNIFTTQKNLAQLVDTRYVLQYKAPIYKPSDIDRYYELPFTRTVPKELRGFQFSVITHRGCIGNCNFCSLRLTNGLSIVSRSEESILKEIQQLTKHPQFRGQIDDLSAPSPNMYGLDCQDCQAECIDCQTTKERSRSKNSRFLRLLKKARNIPGVKKVNIRSGIRYDLTNPEILKELIEYHTYGFLRIAPEHINKKVLKLMNKDKEDLDSFLERFKKTANQSKLSFYFMTAHPGSTIKESQELAKKIKKLKNTQAIQIFTPTPMTNSTCMYYTGLDPATKQPIYIPYSYKEKKEQKRILFSD